MKPAFLAICAAGLFLPALLVINNVRTFSSSNANSHEPMRRTVLIQADQGHDSSIKPWVDSSSEQASFITGSPATQPALLVDPRNSNSGRLTGANAEASESTMEEPYGSSVDDESDSMVDLGDDLEKQHTKKSDFYPNKGVRLFLKIQKKVARFQRALTRQKLHRIRSIVLKYKNRGLPQSLVASTAPSGSAQTGTTSLRGKWSGQTYSAAPDAPTDDFSATPWQFPGQPNLPSNLRRALGQVPDLVSDHLHNEEFEEMLDTCKQDASCAALMSKGFWWLFGKPWRRCTLTSTWACNPYHCAANQPGTTQCRYLQDNPIQALVDLDVRCWDTGRSLWQFSMTRDGCQDYLPWKGGTGANEYLRIGYQCHGCGDHHCPCGPPCVNEPNLDPRGCTYHWTSCAPGSGPGANRMSKNWGGSGDLGQNDWLAHHVVRCPPNTYLSEWRVSRERCPAGQLRIRYRCCENYWGPCRTLSTTGSTSSWADGLENHNVQCDPRTESLNHFQWTGNNFVYTCCCDNICCMPAFGGGRDKKQEPYWPYGLKNPIHPREPQRPDDGAWTRNPPDSPHYLTHGGDVTKHPRPPPDDPNWMREELGPTEHHEYSIWKSNPIAQLEAISSHLDGKHDAD